MGRRCRARTDKGIRCTRDGDRKGGFCWQHEGITKSGLKKRGWTDAGIRDFLGEPDRTAPNPKYRYAAPMKIWHLHKVNQIEETDEWKEWRKASEKRREVARKAVKARKEETVEMVDSISIKLPDLDREELTKRAVESYNSYWKKRERKAPWGHPRKLEYMQKGAAANDDAEFLARIMVNYLRHNQTRYDQLLGHLKGKVGKHKARMCLYRRIYNAIAEKYPWLRSEAKRQLREKLHYAEMQEMFG